MKLYKPFRLLTKIVPYPELQTARLFVQWKNRLLFVLLAALLILGFLAYLPSVTLAVILKFWDIVIVDTLVYAVVVVTALSKKMSSDWKLKIILITFYLLGIALLLLLGKEGAGFNWLFLFPLFSGFFYEYRGIVISTIINFVSLSLLFIPVYFEIESAGMIAQYNPGGWIVNSINFLIISVLSTLGLTIVIFNIDKSLKKERRVKQLLQKNQKQLETEKKRAEESDRLKSAFLANMSHEIRTPLNAIIGFSSLMSDPDIPKEKIKHYSSLIDMAGNQLAGIIGDIIDISKIEHEQMELHIKRLNVYQNLRVAVETQKTRIASLKKDIKLEIPVPNELKQLWIETDELRFKQILNNLIGNAVKYTQSGKISVTYETKTLNDAPVVLFSVKDTGRGIPEDAHQLIFERFAQADNVEFHEGTGLGLSITKGLLDLLGGTIWLESELNKGSSFYFTLPVSSESTEKVDLEDDDEVFVPPDLKGKIIYIAEDDNSSYTLLREILAPLNAKTERANNGKELLELIAQKTPDMVLLDIRMPVMDGLEAVREIRKLNYSFPVIAQTAYAMPADKQKCLDLGCNDTVTKPIKQDELLKTIVRWLDR